MNKSLDFLEQVESDKISFLKETEPLKQFWNSFNEYINKSKENRESLDNSLFIEYLYNRIYSLLFLLKTYYGKTISETIDDKLPF